MANDQLVLYDLPSKGRCACWSSNVWKTRLALNYKNIPYTTEWLEYPEIAPKMKSWGVPPNAPGSFSEYSLPAVKMPNGEYIMESLNIARKLETLYPEPSLQLDADIYAAVNASVDKSFMPAVMKSMAFVCHDILREPSKSWFWEDRTRRFGTPLHEFEQEKGDAEMWKGVEAGLDSLKLEMTKHKKDEGPFVLGSTVSHCDFIIAGLFEWIKRTHSGLYKRFTSYDESLVALHEACKPWFERDHH